MLKMKINYIKNEDELRYFVTLHTMAINTIRPLEQIVD